MPENVLIGTYENIKTNLTQNGFNVSAYSTIDYGIQFNIHTTGWTGLIRVYQNKKGLIRIDYSQLKNNKSSASRQAFFVDRIAYWNFPGR